MSTKDTVIKYIQDLVDAGEAEKFFGKSTATVKSWLKTRSIPGSVYERVLDTLNEDHSEHPAQDMPVVTASQPEATAAVEATAAETFYPQMEMAHHWQSEVERLLNELLQAVHSLHQRLSYIEGNGPANAQQFTPMPAQRGTGQQVFEPAPRDSNVGSMTRPGGTVLGTITTPANSTGRKPSDGWLKPRPLRQVVSQ